MIEPQMFRKKPVTIEAMKNGPTARDAHGVTCWMTENLYPGLIGNATQPETLRYHDQVPGDNTTPDKGWWIDPANGDLMIRTLEGDMRAGYGDWVIRGVNGEFYPCKDAIFRKTYEDLANDGIEYPSITEPKPGVRWEYGIQYPPDPSGSTMPVERIGTRESAEFTIDLQRKAPRGRRVTRQKLVRRLVSDWESA